MTSLDQLLRDLSDAITNEGIQPKHHRKVMARHRQEWPTLWTAIDALVGVRAPVEDTRTAHDGE